jgi:hypothetical protein
VQDIGRRDWDENNQQARSNRQSYNQETWKKLWKESKRMAGIEK